ncbi:DUF4340 domain-containing protein [Acidobacteria bacterium AH-259-O06]|nr:DUF4340 domain-containing protein [Acidobacteria bacterium AH-259-O06]
MKKILVLFAMFLALAAFVYFYEIKGQEKREEAKELEESLLRMKQEEITSVEISRPDKEPITMKKEGEDWAIKQPVETSADRNTVDSLLRNLELARRDRTFPEGGNEVDKYGLKEPRMTLKVRGEEEEKTLLIGGKDFTGNKIYVQFQRDPTVFLTSDYIFSTADKDLSDWRSKKVLAFEKSKVQAIEIINPSNEIRLTKQDEYWVLESPLQERADQSSVSSLLSKLEFAEAQEFVSEQPEELKSYGLDKPKVKVRVRQEGEDRWRTLELGKKKEEDYLARNPDRSPVFTVKEDVFEKLNEKVWEFRDKEVLDVEQDQVAQLIIRRGDEEIALRHEDFKWIVEEPESQKDQEALSYKFWYPIDDIKFESIHDKKPVKTESSFPEPDTRVIVKLKDGSTRTYDFAQKGDEYLARRLESGRQGTISKEAFEKLQFKVEDIV